jgi:transposase
VRAYESSDETYEDVAERFAVGEATLQRWVRRQRDTGALDPLAKAGGWASPVDVALLHALVRERPDRTTDELTRAYNRRAVPVARVHRSSILRALQRTGYVFKKNDSAQRSPIVRASRPSAPRSERGSGR